MAFKLTKDQASRLADLTGAAKEKAAALEEAITVFNERLEELFEPVRQAADALNEAQSELRGFVEDAAAEWSSEYDDKSEKWQESEKGESARAFIDAWEEWEFEEVSIEPPDPLDVEIPDFEEGPPEEAE